MDDAQLDLFVTPEPPPHGMPERGPSHPRLWLGSCAWQHDSFDHHFYPRGLAKTKQLAYYARYFNAVEIDGTFYRVPAVDTVRRWVDDTPPDFRFTAKAPRSVTHDGALDLDAPMVRRDWQAMLAAIATFGPRLGALLVQLAPTTTVLSIARLGRLLATLPPGLQTAVEFRHPSWNTAEAHDLLREHNVSRAWVDHYHDPTRGIAADSPWLLAATGPIVYIRLLGDVSIKYQRGTGDRLFRYGSRLFDRRDDITRWVDRIRSALRTTAPVYTFVNNHYEGFAPLTVAAIRAGLGPVAERDIPDEATPVGDGGDPDHSGGDGHPR
jgi:uncharacterized protein YecE (DUF72 family)